MKLETNDLMSRCSSGGRERSGDQSAGFEVEGRQSMRVQILPLSVTCSAMWSPSDLVFGRGGRLYKKPRGKSALMLGQP